ncbi:MAG: P-loop NTPase, partial [Planctomycetota bacterium]
MQMTVAQNLKATGAVVVTTPQDVALADVERAIGMFNIPALKTKILGIVENMSVFV